MTSFKGLATVPSDLAGRVFGRLTVLGKWPGDRRGVLTRCECGCEKRVDRSSLLSGATASCGCLHRERSRAKAKPLAERFWPKVCKTEGCWLWTAGRNKDGYGQFLGREIGENRAHRIAWVIAKGPIPDGMAVCHRCDNPACVRPDHLFLGTQPQNVADMMAKARHRPLRGEAHGRAKIDEAAVRAIRGASGSLREIGERFGLTLSGIHAIKHRRIWRHVP